MKPADFHFKPLNFVIHPLFFKSVADKKVKEWKFQNPNVFIYAEMINELLRIQQLSSTTGVKGILILHNSLKELQAVSDCSNLTSFDDFLFFELHVFADIKQYLFHYKISYLDINNESREFSKVSALPGSYHKLQSIISHPLEQPNTFLVQNSMKTPNFTPIVKNLLNSVPNGSQIHIYSTHQPDQAYHVVSDGKPSINHIHCPIQHVDLKSVLDPSTLVYESSMLNLSLMKWRLVPDLDLIKHAELKCLILGTGTLGCNLIRCLLGWGVKHFTLVDSGVVSYSNPVRQSLFTIHDVGKPKTEAAKLRILDIAPYAVVEAIQMRIPMPDHPSLQLDQEINQLWDLIKSHDAIFLLTDSRESRWLPTVLGRYENKIVMTAALGFDSLLALSHSKEHGCYFCSDVVAPVNSLEDRTLDQQCTVTRPGLSFIACGLIGEMVVSLLQKSLLGDMPQQIRLFMSQNTYMSSIGVAYDKCSACSMKIMEGISENGLEFIKECLGNPKGIETLTGLDTIGDVDVDWDEEGEDI